MASPEPNELEELIRSHMVAAIRASGDGMAMAQAGLWCPFCGADDPADDHVCKPSTKTLEGLTAGASGVKASDRADSGWWEER